jgi:hypothetical protein
MMADLLMTFHELIEDLVSTEMAIADPTTGMVQIIDQVDVEMPIEMRVEVNEAGQVTLMGSPPTQRTETTVLPVFHQMRIRVCRDSEPITDSIADPITGQE